MWKLAQQRIEALHAFVEQQGWQQTEVLPPSFAPLPPTRYKFIVSDGKTSVTVTVSRHGGLDLRGDDGKLKTMILEWIRQVQPQAFVLKRELKSYQPSTTKPRGTAWKFDHGSWTQVEEVIYSHLGEEGPDLDEVIRQAGYESRASFRLGAPESSFCVEVYPSQKGENAPSPRYPYFVGVQMPTEYECIYVTDFPSLVSLLSQLGTIVDKIAERRQS